VSWGAQFEQDRIAHELCGTWAGTFIDIGATDGITRNNTYALERDYEWNGICIEPVLHSYVELRKNRKCLTLHAAVTGNNRVGVARFFEDPGNHEVSKLQESAKNLITCVSLNHVAAILNRPIDYLSIDTEGAELEILASFDFYRYPVHVINFEHNDHWGPAQKANKAAIETLLIVNGYYKHCDVGVDSFYVRKP
jgi:FkbM family methyltransferase